MVKNAEYRLMVKQLLQKVKNYRGKRKQSSSLNLIFLQVSTDTTSPNFFLLPRDLKQDVGKGPQCYKTAANV